MSRSDSKIDLAKYAPSLEAMREVLDEKAAQERMRKALDNPALDAALVEYRGDAVTVPTGVPVARTVQPSPWGAGATGAAGAAGVVDKGLLPSAHAPVTTGVGAAGAAEEKPRAAWSTTNKALAAIGLAFLPAMLVFLLFVKPAPQGAQGVVGSGSGAVPGSAMVIGGAGETLGGSVQSAVPMPSGEASAGAPDASVPLVAPLPVTPAVPVVRPKVNREIKNARDTTPRPSKTVEIVTPPAPIPPLAPVGHPTPTAVPSAAPPAKPEIIN